MTQSRRPGAGRRRTARLAPLGLLGLAPLAGIAQAAPVDFSPYAEVDVDHSDNLFLTPSDPAQLALTARPLAADTYTTLMAGIEITRDSLGSNAFARGEARRVDYKDFTQLNHDEYDASLGYSLGSRKGNHLAVELGANRKLVPFLSLASDNTFAIERQRFVRLIGQVQVGEFGRVEATAERHDLHSPVPGAPEYAVAEDQGDLAFTRGALESLEYGARVQYLRGHYSGQRNISDYTQWVPQLFLKREIKRLLKMNVQVGAAHRTQEGLPTTNGLVGGADLHYQISGRTSAYVGAARSIYGYYASAGSQDDVNLIGGLSWAATYRLTLSVDYSHVHSNVDVTSPGGARTDNHQLGTLTLDWQPTRWVTIRAYARKQKRDSSSALYVFDATGEGISVRIRRPPRD